MQIYIMLNYRQLGIPKVDHEVLTPSRDFERNTATFADMPTLRKLKEEDSLSSVSSRRPTMVGPEDQRKF